MPSHEDPNSRNFKVSSQLVNLQTSKSTSPKERVMQIKEKLEKFLK